MKITLIQHQKNYLFKIFCLIIISYLSGCINIAADHYNKNYQKVLLGRVSYKYSGNKYTAVKPVDYEVATFIKQPKFGPDLSVKGNGLIIANAYNSDYIIKRLEMRNGNMFGHATIYLPIKIGDEKGVYYFGNVTFIYKGQEISEVIVEDTIYQEIKDAKDYVKDIKNMKVINITEQTKREMEKINNASRNKNKIEKARDLKKVDKVLEDF